MAILATAFSSAIQPPQRMMTDYAAIPRRLYWNRAFTVAREWVRHPTQVASIIPSFPFLTRTIAERACVRDAKKIVELGPGTGGTTESLLRNASPQARVLAIEKTAGFIEPLEAIDDSRLTVVQDDVVGLERILKVNDFESPDVIVSGIPFSSLDSNTAEATMQAIHRTLDDRGTFIAYQLRSHVAHYAGPYFGEPTVQNVLVNLPPLRVFTWQKNDDTSTRTSPLYAHCHEPWHRDCATTSFITGGSDDMTKMQMFGGPTNHSHAANDYVESKVTE